MTEVASSELLLLRALLLLSFASLAHLVRREVLAVVLVLDLVIDFLSAELFLVVFLQLGEPFLQFLGLVLIVLAVAPLAPGLLVGLVLLLRRRGGGAARGGRGGRCSSGTTQQVPTVQLASLLSWGLTWYSVGVIRGTRSRSRSGVWFPVRLALVVTGVLRASGAITLTSEQLWGGRVWRSNSRGVGGRATSSEVVLLVVRVVVVVHWVTILVDQGVRVEVNAVVCVMRAVVMRAIVVVEVEVVMTFKRGSGWEGGANRARHRWSGSNITFVQIKVILHGESHHGSTVGNCGDDSKSRFGRHVE
jgi:hypothetical protein